MINIKEEIKKIIGFDCNVEMPKKDNMGDFSVPCFNLTTEENKNPVSIAASLKDQIKLSKYFNKVENMGPYLNFFVNYDVLGEEVLKEIETKKNTYGSNNQGNNEALVIEHTSINPNASPHIGRSRNALIGDFLKRLYKFVNYNVETHYFVNDIGKQIAFLVVGVNKYKNENLSFNEILDLYVKINEEAKTDESIEKEAFEILEKLENGDEEARDLFKSITDMCVKGQTDILGDLDISYDVFTHESDFVFGTEVENILKRLDETGRLKEDETGRYYLDLTGYDIPTKEPVLVLTRANKTSLYPLRDIAYSIYKMNVNEKNNFIVLGEDQITYMKQIAAALDILGYPAPKLTSYSFVLLDGGKMSTRGGTLVLLEDFIKETNNMLKESFDARNILVKDEDINKITGACIKFTMLNVSKDKCVNFNWDKATSFTGESGLYILYSIVRINSILNKNEVKECNIKFNYDIEHKILKDLYNFPNVIDSLLQSNEPAVLTKYIFNLTQKFSKFYEEVNVNNEEDEDLKQSRLKLLQATKTVLTNALEILGISTIDKM